MAEENQPPETEPSLPWGTWEDLLLACAVNRHGFKDWNSIAMEIQARSSLPLPITARNCELKFLNLKRRFNGDEVDFAVSWIDELRKLRVAELRREVQRYDVSINSLQLKVKKLEEDRESSLNNNEAGAGKPDLQTERGERRSENDKNLIGEPDYRSGPNGTVAKSPAVLSEDFSVNQSNSTGSKSGNLNSSAENVKSETKPDFAGSYRPDQNRRAAGPQSDDGSTDTVVEKEEKKRVDDSSELADSNGGESGEVQSSASLAGRVKRKRLLKKEISGGSSGTEPRRPAAVKSRRFDEVLQMIRAHKHGSVFESRLQSQETEEYKGMVRQHLDLETVQAKVNSGSYLPSSLAFYRDLLLLCNNATTFFPKSSKESVAAREIRLLVSNEMKKSLQIPRTDPSLPEDMDSSPVNPSGSKGLDLEGSQPLPAKPKSSVSILVCRKRSTTSSKLSSSGLVEKGDRSNNDEKSAANLKLASTAVEDHETNTKDSDKVKEKPIITGARGMRRGNDSTTNSSGPSIKKPTSNTGWKPSPANETETPKPDKKKLETVALEKKRGAANFLKRIKQNSPAEAKKRNGRGGSNAAAVASGEQKNSGKSNTENERVLLMRQSNDKKLPNEEASPTKRSIGRLPKKTAEADPAPGPTKRSREGGGKEPLKRARKRARR